MGIGALIGVPVGALIGWQETEGKHFFGGGSADRFGILVGGAPGLLSGLIIGAVFGGSAGHRETYILENSQ
jgi:hypothetical protein